MRKVEISYEPERRVAALRHTGAYRGIGEAFERAGRLVHDAGAEGRFDAMIAAYHDNPQHVAEDKLKSHAGFVLKPGCKAPRGMQTIGLSAGRYAVYRHRGPYAGLPDAYRWLMSEWLEKSGEDLTGESTFEIYENQPGQVAEADLLTRIYLPIEDEDFNGPV